MGNTIDLTGPFGGRAFVDGNLNSLAFNDSTGTERGYIAGGSRLVPLNVDDAVAYFYDDFINPGSFNSVYNTSGMAVPGGNTAGITCNQQGVVSGSISSVSQKYWAAANQSYNAYYNGYAQKWQWRVYFMVPSILSSTNARYTFSVGSFGYNASVNSPVYGAYVQYTDNVNSGNWVLCTNTTNTATPSATANSSTAIGSAATWHVLTITATGQTFTFYMDGVSLGTVTDTTIHSANDTSWSGFNMLPSMAVNCTAYTSGVPQFAMDAGDCLITGLAR